ncbi:hypothetical protein [Candidatus Nitrospira allomarina]|jgi:hypothetical protein|uniref:Uncharacterized protein n=1 Tax=Candidatus Nitrospira allomarina TaxID=3020900 RepID=A0AA96K0T7_9BACT|nr:hypothetical protein [Candidatus Nitrospira allomarina]WNM60014.1 hypothetical protein PP769_09720 [Candidatus Nitrospira allomarina]
MKSFCYLFFGFFIFIFGVPLAQASEKLGMAANTEREIASLTMLSGEVKDVDGDWCVVQDSEGTEWKIQVDNYTETIGNVLPGVTIAAMVEPDGHAKEVKVLPE